MIKPMKILITVATVNEIKPVIDFSHISPTPNLYKSTIPDVDIFVSGLGIVSTTFNLTRFLSTNHYSFVINAGICGSFDSRLELGQVVDVQSDTFADCLVETGSDVLTWNEAKLDLIDNNVGLIYNLTPNKPLNLNNLVKVKSITCDTVHANRQTIDMLKKIFNPDIETMEGAAVFYVCKLLNYNSLQLRAVSNIVGIRDKKQWKTDHAINNLVSELKRVVEKFNQQNYNTDNK